MANVRGANGSRATRNGRKPLDGGRSRDAEVVKVAIKLFSEQGYASTSMQDIADAMGILKGSLYYYIDTKETLLRRVFDDSHRASSEIAERYREGEAPAVERFRGFVHDYATWTMRHQDQASLFAREWRHAKGEIRTVMLEQRKYYDMVLGELIEGARSEGSARADVDVRMASNFVMAAIASLPDWVKPRGQKSIPEIADEYADMALRVLGAK